MTFAWVFLALAILSYVNCDEGISSQMESRITLFAGNNASEERIHNLEALNRFHTSTLLSILGDKLDETRKEIQEEIGRQDFIKKMLDGVPQHIFGAAGVNMTQPNITTRAYPKKRKLMSRGKENLCVTFVKFSGVRRAVCSEDNYQNFEIDAEGYLKNLESGRCLGVITDTWSFREPYVREENCGGGATGKWTEEKNGLLKSVGYGDCLTGSVDKSIIGGTLKTLKIIPCDENDPEQQFDE